ncbi:MAG: hypothetical protein O3B47_02845 [bacterium]|nr:hypothetical protein [bacterium]
MNIKGILKLYLVLTLSLSGVAILSYSDTAVQYYNTYSATVFNAFGDFDEKPDYKYFDKKPFASAYSLDQFIVKRQHLFLSENKNPNIANFSISSDPEKRFVKPGTNGAEIMQLIFKTGNEDLELDNLTFKIVGVDPSMIANAYLFDGGKELRSALHNQDKLIFNNIDYLLTPNGQADLSVRLSLSNGLKNHDRVRLDIESPEDISIYVAGKPFSINEYYPIRGEYLSISSPRMWGPDWGLQQ